MKNSTQRVDSSVKKCPEARRAVTGTIKLLLTPLA